MTASISLLLDNQFIQSGSFPRLSRTDVAGSKLAKLLLWQGLNYYYCYLFHFFLYIVGRVGRINGGVPKGLSSSTDKWFSLTPSNCCFCFICFSLRLHQMSGAPSPFKSYVSYISGLPGFPHPFQYNCILARVTFPETALHRNDSKKKLLGTWTAVGGPFANFLLQLSNDLLFWVPWQGKLPVSGKKF